METQQQKNRSSLVVKWRQSWWHDPCFFGVDSKKPVGWPMECADQMFTLYEDNDDLNNLRFSGRRGTALHVKQSLVFLVLTD